MQRMEREREVEVREVKRVYTGRHPLTIARDGTVHMGTASAMAYERGLDLVERRMPDETHR